MGFVAAFSLKTDAGKLRWDMDMPYGTIESGIEIRRTKEMSLDLPPRTRAREETDERGDWYVLAPISVQPKQSMVFTLEGLPEPSAWSEYGKYLVGVLVLLIGLGTLALILVPKKAAAVSPQTRYDALIEELAALGVDGDEGRDVSAADAAKRTRIMDELEALHRAGAARR
jgi:hypothetical protein